MLKSKAAAGLLIGLLSATASQAASITYCLDQSDKLSDGTNYLQVTIADGVSGAINFTVEVLQPLIDLAVPNANFGIVKFAFNAVPGIPLSTSNVDISGLPSGWVKGPHQDMAGFGNYDMRLRITNADTPRSNSISFSVTGIDFDTITSYVDQAIGSTEGPSFFSARVGGLDLACCEDPEGYGPNDAFFGGMAAKVVPAPPALWLLGTAIAGLGVHRFRSAKAA